MGYIKRKVIWAGCKLSREKTLEIQLPWRKQRTPYRIFLAEMLLIRTRVGSVEKIFEDLYNHYPNIRSLSEANEEELRISLYPLGLSKRVSYFIKAARYICEEYNEEIPDKVDELLEIPGIGYYTATAVVTFAFEKKLVPADVNIFRFLSRLTGLEMKDRTKGSRELRQLLPFLAESHTGLKAEHLLDFTRLICRSLNPACTKCPLTRNCNYINSTRT